MGFFIRFVKGKRPEIAVILYYNLYKDNLYDRIETTDLLCTEPQDVLSLGHHHIPEFWKPALSIKLGRSLDDRPLPFGIVHSCPGMDWRHTGLPPAEYRFWLSQIPAHGGNIWHSLTGVPDTITDKRILDTVKAMNRDVIKVEHAMEGARTLSSIALLWLADAAAEGWADGLINRQMLFDVLLDEQATAEKLQQYKVLIVTERKEWDESFIERVMDFVQAGGQLIVEGSVPQERKLLQLLGIGDEMAASEPLRASYLRFEGRDNNPLQRGLEQTELLAHAGIVYYIQPLDDRTEVLATLVPPFSPMESVGAPPERASLPVSHTQLPLVIRTKTGRGAVYYLPFEFSGMLNEFKLGEHYQLLANLLTEALGEEQILKITHYQGLQTTMFAREDAYLLHLVNGAGRRPLAAMIPLPQLEVRIRTDNRVVKAVRLLISEQELDFIVGVCTTGLGKVIQWG